VQANTGLTDLNPLIFNFNTNMEVSILHHAQASIPSDEE